MSLFTFYGHLSVFAGLDGRYGRDEHTTKTFHVLYEFLLTGEGRPRLSHQLLNPVPRVLVNSEQSARVHHLELHPDQATLSRAVARAVV